MTSVNENTPGRNEEPLPSDDVGGRTRQSLLIRLRDSHDESAWREFYALYSPLLYDYARARGLRHEDAEDVRSECLAAIVRQMPKFVYDRSLGSFRSWLRTMTVRRVIDRLRKSVEVTAGSAVLAVIDSHTDSPDEIWEREWRHQHLRFCMDEARTQVNPQTWEIFELLVDHQTPVAEICSRLNVRANQVYKARARVLEMIRDRMKYLTAEDAGESL